MTDEEYVQLMEETARNLGEHFDAVQILASRHENGMTGCIKRGSGNWYARQGMAHEFINSDVAQDAAQQIAERLKESSDDAE